MRWQRLQHEEDGQALIYGAGIMVLLVAIFFGAIDIAGLVLGQIQAQNAADAAAMSAAALKASVHNTRSLAYRATTGQLSVTRLRLINAAGLALSEIATPGQNLKAPFQQAIDKAHKSRIKVERLREGIREFNTWVTGSDAGPALVKQAAEIGILGNLGTLANADRYNLSLLDQGGSLPENQPGFSSSVGGVIYAGEAMGPSHFSGKSFVHLEPKVNTIGSALMTYAAKAQLGVSAVAGPLPASSVFSQSLGALDATTGYGIEWYTVRLLPIGGGN